MEKQTAFIKSSRLEQDIKDWILTRLSTAHPAFNNLPPCPFAKEALLTKKVRIHRLLNPALSCVHREIELFESYNADVLVLVDEDGRLTRTETESLVEMIRKQYSLQNYWVMYDHPDVDEYVDEFDVSFNKAPLLFLQKLDNLNLRAAELESRGYYKNWSPEYYEDVVKSRARLAPKL
jgi:hypothetical protein